MDLRGQLILLFCAVGVLVASAFLYRLYQSEYNDNETLAHAGVVEELRDLKAGEFVIQNDGSILVFERAENASMVGNMLMTTRTPRATSPDTFLIWDTRLARLTARIVHLDDPDIDEIRSAYMKQGLPEAPQSTQEE